MERMGLSSEGLKAMKKTEPRKKPLHGYCKIDKKKKVKWKRRNLRDYFPTKEQWCFVEN
jgi:hypothetical protein